MNKIRISSRDVWDEIMKKFGELYIIIGKKKEINSFYLLVGLFFYVRGPPGAYFK